MSSNINRVMITGRLTRDAVLRRTQSGLSVLDFNVAVNDRRRNPQTGEWGDFANFVDCAAFGNRAEGLANILKKGMKVAVEGKLRFSQWDQDGQKRSKLSVVADSVDFMSQRAAENESAAAPEPSGSQSAREIEGFDESLYDEDVSF